MHRTVLIACGALVVAAAAVAGAGTAAGLAPALTGTAVTGDDNGPDQVLTGSDLDRAIQAALAHTGGGTVTDSEVGDAGASYGVEIRTPDGRHVEVQLDSAFAVVGEESDENDSD